MLVCQRLHGMEISKYEENMQLSYRSNTSFIENETLLNFSRFLQIYMHLLNERAMYDNSIVYV